MKVLVTGASGFLGTNLVHHLAGRGDQVTAFMPAELTEAAFHRRLAMLDPPGLPAPARQVAVALGGFEDTARLEALVDDAELVIHTAGTVRGSHPEVYRRLNPGLVERLLAVRSWRPSHRLVHVSSVAAQGPGSSPEPVPESAPPAPRGLYGGSKRRAEELLLASRFPGRLLLVRPCSIVGPLDPSFLDVFGHARRGWYVKLGSPEKWFQIVYVADLCRAIARLAERLGGEGLPAWPDGPVVQVAHPQVLDHALWKAAFERAVGRPIRTLWLPPWTTYLLGACMAAWERLSGAPQLLSPDKMADMRWPYWVHSVARFQGLEPDFAFTPHAQALAETDRWYTRTGTL